MPSAANGISATSTSAVISSHCPNAQAHAERDAGRVEQHDAGDRHQVAGEHLGAQVAARRQRGQPQLPVPADRALGRDARAAGEHGDHARRRRAGRPCSTAARTARSGCFASPPKLWLSLFGAGEQEVHDEREDQREDEGLPVAEQPQQSRTGCRSACSCGASSALVSSSPVSCRNASSRPAPVTSMSRASGKAGRNARSAASESEQFRITASPRVSTLVTPGSAPMRGEVGAGQRRADRAQPDRRLDLGGRAVGDDAAVRHQDDPVGVGVGLLEVVRREQHRLAAGGEVRASSPRSRAAPRRPSRPSARRARAGRGC